ncbi:MAG TPA: hypothetical protein VMT16_01125 [Thermoanaerobaculia bacterium]|nr:hypothetical protein [Thermoanaerobaculia bacterium]
MPRFRSPARLVVVVMGALCWPGGAAAQEAAELQRQIDELRRVYEVRVQALEERVGELEAALRAAQRAPPPGAGEVGERPADELSALRAAAEAAAGDVAETPAALAEDAPAVGRERNLNRLNPEISLTGDVLALAGDGTPDFAAREFEIDFQSALDPFSSAKLTLAFAPEEEEIEVEEGYVRYAGFAPGLTLRAGRMRQTFGVLNRWHLHALPQPDYPLALRTYFDDEGLAQTGVSLEWLLPRGWATANELTVQLTDGSSEPFGGDSFERLVGLAHLKSYWDLTPATYLEWGLSGAAGEPEPGRSSRVWGSDLTLHWQPPARAKYRELTWRSELLLSQRDDDEGSERQAWGGYSYLEGLLRRNLYAGVRYDRVEDPFAPQAVTWAVVPYVTWWQSEFVRLRAAYEHLHDGFGDESDGRFTLQLTWAAGPHKHETY